MPVCGRRPADNHAGMCIHVHVHACTLSHVHAQALVQLSLILAPNGLCKQSCYTGSLLSDLHLLHVTSSCASSLVADLACLCLCFNATYPDPGLSLESVFISCLTWPAPPLLTSARVLTTLLPATYACLSVITTSGPWAKAVREAFLFTSGSTTRYVTSKNLWLVFPSLCMAGHKHLNPNPIWWQIAMLRLCVQIVGINKHFFYYHYQSQRFSNLLKNLFACWSDIKMGVVIGNLRY